jgi:hypothetical protein
MDGVISEYQRWKQQGESLRVQARQAMENRFRDLLTEAASISEEYQKDFGTLLKPPAQVTAFKFKASVKKAQKNPKTSKSAPAPVSKTLASQTQAAANPKIGALEKRLAQAKAKLDAAKAAGKATRNHEDKIYEIEDEIRLATQPA